MRTFIYTTTEKRTNMGGTKVLASVYEIKKNMPIHVAYVDWNTASFKGNDSTIMNHLAKENILPKKYESTYYSYEDRSKFTFIKL